ncbi:MAG TPA: uracil-DNA glycosylase [Thermoanaerobaculia bacterium]|mgnify:CR=1 FL=1|nr:uracil-DNA glycosylase [Thermoanaerobaculia bacterium]
MSQPSPADLGPLLDYLQDLGFDSLYRAGAGGPGAAEKQGSAANSSGASLAELEQRALACKACRLAETRKKVVFGTGDPHARLMFVGEGPGGEEDLQGLPFVGPAGQLLNRMIQAMGHERSQVYIANIVKCRPPGNRDPQPDEVAACKGFLDGQIAAVGPRVLVALGRVAAQVLLGNETPIGRLRGNWYQYQGIPMMVTYHPAALLRNEALKRPTWNDLQQVRDRLREPATT